MIRESLHDRDLTACEQLIRIHGGRLLATTRRFLRDEDEAWDALRDTFLLAFRIFPTLEEDVPLSISLHRLAINAALMKLSTCRRQPEQLIDELLPTFLEDGRRANPGLAWKKPLETALQHREARVFVRECIDQLPESYRIVLLLRDIEGINIKETAELLDISPNVVEIRLHHARQALRKLLDPYFCEGGKL
jgi:RNA polymerase sigma-70 factor (ECF subfamily)